MVSVRTVGDIVGWSQVGPSYGVEVGVFDTFVVGRLEGFKVGTWLGFLVFDGLVVGSIVGNLVGNTVGSFEGLKEGITVGIFEGLEEGATVGNLEGFLDGKAVGAGVRGLFVGTEVKFD